MKSASSTETGNDTGRTGAPEQQPSKIIYVWWSEDGKFIRQWQTWPFKEGLPYALTENSPTPKGDAQDAALWRDLVLLSPMDVMMIFSGAGSDKVLLSKIKTFIERKRGEQR